MSSHRIPLFDLSVQYRSIQGEIDSAVAEFLAGGTYMGREAIQLFEKQFAEYLGVANCVGVANGTDAIEMALEVLGIEIGDEVLVPAISWISTASAVTRVGATPVFVDILPDQRTIDPSELLKKISPRTKAVIPVHLFGQPAQMSEIMEIAKKHHLKVIEDCAQAHGAAISGQKVGSFGDLATFSFYPTKNLGAIGDAGAVIAQDEAIAKQLRKLANVGTEGNGDHKQIGRNSRLDGLQATVLKVKLKFLDQWIDQKNEVAARYDQHLSDVKRPKRTDEVRHGWHLYVIELAKRDQNQRQLNKAGVQTKIHYPIPLPFLTCYQSHQHSKGDFPVAERFANQALSLPLYPELKRENQKIIIESISLDN